MGECSGSLPVENLSTGDRPLVYRHCCSQLMDFTMPIHSPHKRYGTAQRRLAMCYSLLPIKKTKQNIHAQPSRAWCNTTALSVQDLTQQHPYMYDYVKYCSGAHWSEAHRYVPLHRHRFPFQSANNLSWNWSSSIYSLLKQLEPFKELKLEVWAFKVPVFSCYAPTLQVV